MKKKSSINLYLEQLKDKNKKIQVVFVRMSPIMETLTGVMIAVLIFYSGKLMAQNELDINNFFSFLAAMMLAYQPVRSLANFKYFQIKVYQVQKEFYQLLIMKIKLKIKNAKDLNLKNGQINFENVKFKYDKRRR